MQSNSQKLIWVFILGLLLSCKQSDPKKIETTVTSNTLEGSWKLIYGEVREKDSTEIKNLDSTDFIKIINRTHFAFFNQNKNDGENFYGGACTYSLNGNEYVEKLDFINSPTYRGHSFPFIIEIKGDTLIQSGIEEIEVENIKREIVEKYIRIK